MSSREACCSSAGGRDRDSSSAMSYARAGTKVTILASSAAATARSTRTRSSRSGRKARASASTCIPASRLRGWRRQTTSCASIFAHRRQRSRRSSQTAWVSGAGRIANVDHLSTSTPAVSPTTTSASPSTRICARRRTCRPCSAATCSQSAARSLSPHRCLRDRIVGANIVEGPTQA